MVVAARPRRPRHSAPPHGLLTHRQQEVIALTWHGLTNHAIGRLLGLQPSTVKNVLEDAYRRLHIAEEECPRVMAAVYLWWRCGKECQRGEEP